ncbi:hypothetical protein M3627_01745 [Psychrobacillus sp. MER TA 171]|nr:hypothetical protein [Psychrobacillus sp. MER TA 171]
MQELDKKSVSTYVCPDRQMEKSEEAAPQIPLVPFALGGKKIEVPKHETFIDKMVSLLE